MRIRSSINRNFQYFICECYIKLIIAILDEEEAAREAEMRAEREEDEKERERQRREKEEMFKQREQAKANST